MNTKREASEPAIMRINGCSLFGESCRAYIVNMAHITEYDNESITLTNGDRVYLTKKKYGEFVKTYMWFLQNGGVSSV